MTARRRGFTLVEVLVAFAILSLVITASITIFTWQKQRLYEQTLWRRALEAVEEESEAHRALPPQLLTVGEGQRFLTMPESAPELMPESMTWLPAAVARRDVMAVDAEQRLLAVVLTLSWGPDEGRRVTHQEVFLLAR